MKTISSTARLRISTIETTEVDSIFLSRSFTKLDWYGGLFNICHFISCNFADCIFRGSSFPDCKFVECTFTNCRFVKDNMASDCKFERAIAYGCSFEGVEGFDISRN